MAERSRSGSLLWRLDSHSPSTLLQTLQALPNPHDSPLALGSPTRSASVVPVVRFHAVTAAPESSAVASAAHTLRHTFLRKVDSRHGVEFAMQAAGHAST